MEIALVPLAEKGTFGHLDDGMLVPGNSRLGLYGTEEAYPLEGDFTQMPLTFWWNWLGENFKRMAECGDRHVSVVEKPLSMERWCLLNAIMLFLPIFKHYWRLQVNVLNCVKQYYMKEILVLKFLTNQVCNIFMFCLANFIIWISIFDVFIFIFFKT